MLVNVTPAKQVQSDATRRGIKRKPVITASENPKRRIPEKPTSYIHQSRWISDNYSDLKLIGKGAFGLVYRARSKRQPEQVVAIKEILKNSLPQNVVCEMDLVQMLGGKNNILSTLATHRDLGAYVVMEYFPHDEFRDVIKVMSSSEVLHYMSNMIKAIDYLHSHNIIHRDLKPDNFLYNRKHRRYALIDFGLSQKYSENIDRAALLKQRFSLPAPSNSPNPQKKATYQMPCMCEDFKPPCNSCAMKPELIVNKAGTPRFLAPEILVGSSKQTTKIDIWAMGITLFFLITRKYPYFKARQNLEMVTELSALLGSKTFIEMATKHEMSLQMDFELRPLNIAMFAFTHRYGTFNECTALCLPCDYCAEIFQYEHEVSAEDKKDFCLCRPIDLVNQAKILTNFDDRKLAAMLQMCLVVDPDKRESSSSLFKRFGV